MSWASRRRASVSGDIAYSLLGIFDVSMPLLYGEGAEKAFLRLQYEIIKQSDDESIFAFPNRADGAFGQAMLASSPKSFEGSGNIHQRYLFARGSYSITNKGLEIGQQFWPCQTRLHFIVNGWKIYYDFKTVGYYYQYFLLNCVQENAKGESCAISITIYPQ